MWVPIPSTFEMSFEFEWGQVFPFFVVFFSYNFQIWEAVMDLWSWKFFYPIKNCPRVKLIFSTCVAMNFLENNKLLPLVRGVLWYLRKSNWSQGYSKICSTQCVKFALVAVYYRIQILYRLRVICCCLIQYR